MLKPSLRDAAKRGREASIRDGQPAALAAVIAFIAEPLM
jgi:hypothetical protein